MNITSDDAAVLSNVGPLLEAGGLRVRCTIDGTGAPPLLLLHAGGCSLFSWRRVVPALAARYRVIAYDRPGWGGTSRPGPGDWRGRSPYAVESESELALDVLDAAGIAEPAILIGSSAGGTVALMTALTRPDRVRGLVLVSPGVYSGLGRALMPAPVRALLTVPPLRRLAARSIGRSFARSMHATVKKFFGVPDAVSDDLVAAWGHDVRLEGVGTTLLETALASRTLDLEQRLATCVVPTLVLAGDRDRFVPLAENQRLAQGLPRAKLQVLEGCGHLPQEERPDAFVEAVERFVV